MDLLIEIIEMHILIDYEFIKVDFLFIIPPCNL